MLSLSSLCESISEIFKMPSSLFFHLSNFTAQRHTLALDIWAFNYIKGRVKKKGQIIHILWIGVLPPPLIHKMWIICHFFFGTLPLALYSSKNECARTDTVFFPTSQVCTRSSSRIFETPQRLNGRG